MVIICILIGIFLWFLLFALVLKIALFVEDKTHKGAIKKWGMDIEDYEYNRFRAKLFISLFFFGIPILFFVGFIMYYVKGA